MYCICNVEMNLFNWREYLKEWDMKIMLKLKLIEKEKEN